MANIAADKQQILKNQQKRKKEDERLKHLNITAAEHQQTIERLKQSIEKKKIKLHERSEDLDNLRQYTLFLQRVVDNNKDMDES